MVVTGELRYGALGESVFFGGGIGLGDPGVDGR
jgi:hypothetical protein